MLDLLVGLEPEISADNSLSSRQALLGFELILRPSAFGLLAWDVGSPKHQVSANERLADGRDCLMVSPSAQRHSGEFPNLSRYRPTSSS